ncbi:hypothetical protein EC9_14680 [Rosistilla ulvae]|uniref:Uncharacterized protein n=1 Tax=Rosistilla ulvae TaxID=1930277 RepID=A0A517LXF9_9BACT|nr:hypothetical protein EC9_14680 [Rosistilla ulvae]
MKTSPLTRQLVQAWRLVYDSRSGHERQNCIALARPKPLRTQNLSH